MTKVPPATPSGPRTKGTWWSRTEHIPFSSPDYVMSCPQCGMELWLSTLGAIDKSGRSSDRVFCPTNYSNCKWRDHVELTDFEVLSREKVVDPA